MPCGTRKHRRAESFEAEGCPSFEADNENHRWVVTHEYIMVEQPESMYAPLIWAIAHIECMNCGMSYDTSSSWEVDEREVLDAESFSAEQKLKRDSCCCGATKSNPCACMIQGVMKCDATCPCSLEKKGAESFAAVPSAGTGSPGQMCEVCNESDDLPYDSDHFKECRRCGKSVCHECWDTDIESDEHYYEICGECWIVLDNVARYDAESFSAECNHEWINTRPSRFRYHTRCGCGEHMKPHKKGWICSDELHCGAIWDGVKYLEPETYWNWCKHCGVVKGELEGLYGAESFSAEGKCYQCGVSENVQKLWWAGKKGLICGVCSESGVKYRAEEEELTKKEVKMNLWYPLTVGFLGGTISTIVANVISLKWAKKNGHL